MNTKNKKSVSREDYLKKLNKGFVGKFGVSIKEVNSSLKKVIKLLPTVEEACKGLTLAIKKSGISIEDLRK